jgi:ATP-binding cassette subfamily B protein
MNAVRDEHDATLDAATRADAPPLGFARLAAMARVPLTVAVVLAVLSAALSLAPFVLLYLMAVAIFAAPVDVAAVRALAGYALLAILARWVLMGASHCFAHVGAFSVLYRLRLALARQLGRVPMRFFADRRSGELRRTVMSDTASLEGFLAHMLPDSVAAAVVPLVAMALLFAADWRLALAALVPLPVAVVMQWLMLRRSGEQMRQWQRLQENVAAQIVEYLRGMPVVKVFGLSASSFGDLAATIRRVVAWVDTYAGTSAGAWAAFVALLSANVVIVAPLAAWLHARGEVDAPTVVLFLLVAPAVLQPLLRLTFASGEQNRRREALVRIDAVLRAPVLPDRTDATPPDGHAIAFENVDFRYADDEHAAALDGVSFEARAGQVTAIVGPSGAGKSTVLRLLPRFYDVDAGAIRIGGIDVREWPLDTLLGRLGIVLQEVVLFHGTVRENLLLARPDADDATLVAATRAARAHDFIERLPQGYDTPIGDRGARLSGGERQRLSIARALLKDAPILLLDEATSYADAENERLIQQALDAVCRGRTVLMVAHRLHTVRHADHIVVIDAGRIVGQGRHDDLVATCALYRQLWHDHTQARQWQLAAAPVVAAHTLEAQA